MSEHQWQVYGEPAQSVSQYSEEPLSGSQIDHSASECGCSPFIILCLHFGDGKVLRLGDLALTTWVDKALHPPFSVRLSTETNYLPIAPVQDFETREEALAAFAAEQARILREVFGGRK